MITPDPFVALTCQPEGLYCAIMSNITLLQHNHIPCPLILTWHLDEMLHWIAASL